MTHKMPNSEILFCTCVQLAHSVHNGIWNPYLLNKLPVMSKMIILQHEIQSGEYYILSCIMTGIVAL
jgi:hypothetical protein